MMERNRRFILFLAAVLASAPLFIKGRGATHGFGAAPFLPFSSTGIKVRLEGAVRSPGVYVFGPGADLSTVIKLTGMPHPAADESLPLASMPVKNGTSLVMPSSITELTEITMKTMHARERELLGIPLDPDRMAYDDWLSLPGIGPALAGRIVDDRQKNGDFVTAAALKRVPGIGDKKYSHIKNYF